MACSEEEINVTKTVLEVMTFGARQVLSRTFINEAKFDQSYWEHAGEAVALHITQKVLANNLKSIVVVYPSSWWEALKERFMPDWMQMVYPIDYEHVTVRVDDLYPTIPIHNHKPYRYMELVSKSPDSKVRSMFNGIE